MKKSQLKNGMQVIMRNGTIGLVLLDYVSEFKSLRNGSNLVLGTNKRHNWHSFDDWDEDLKSTSQFDSETKDIVEVLVSEHPYAINDPDYKYKSIWKRRFEIDYLDFKIINTGNSDGYTLCYDGCSIGNFTELEDAKEYAIVNWMARRPTFFSAFFTSKALHGRGLHSSYFKLKKALEGEGLNVPKEVTRSEDGNCSIVINGKTL